MLPRNRRQILDTELLDWHADAPIEPDFVTDLLDLCRMIEPQAAQLAAQRATASDIVAMRALLTRMGAARDGDGDCAAADMAFHAVLLNAARNRFLRQLRRRDGAAAGGAALGAAGPAHRHREPSRCGRPYR